jgi:hypothetical protein
MDPEKKKLIEHMFQLLETPSKSLTKWEEDFVESVQEFYQVNKRLSDKQFEVLERIYAEKTD